MVQTDNVDHEFEFVNLRELINKQLARVVEELYGSFSVVQTAANSQDRHTTRLLEEVRRLRQKVATADDAHSAEVSQPSPQVGSASLPDAEAPKTRNPAMHPVVGKPTQHRSSVEVPDCAANLHERFESVMPPSGAPQSMYPNTTAVTDFHHLENVPDKLEFRESLSSQDCEVDELVDAPPDMPKRGKRKSMEARSASKEIQQNHQANVSQLSLMAPPTLAWGQDALQAEHYCTTCGSALIADGDFCGKCGRKRQDGPYEMPLPGTLGIPGTEHGRKKVNIPAESSDDEQNGTAEQHSAEQNSADDGSFAPKYRRHQSEIGTSSSRGSATMNSIRGSALLACADTEPQAEVSASRRMHRFEVLQVWRNSKRNGYRSDHLFKSGEWPMANMNLQSRIQSQGEIVEEKRDFRDQATAYCHIINPNDPRRGFWDMTSLILVLYDMGAIPFEFFDPPRTAFTVLMTWVTRIFWTTDMPMSFLTGYVTTEGFIELRPKKIARRYATSWLSLDLAIVLTDWMELLMSANSSLGFARMGKASRTFRIIRMLRLLRLARMREVLTLITERINSEKVVIVADICKALTIILGLAHFIACLWYAVGASSDPEESWVNQAGYMRAPIADRYCISLHWSIAQFSGGMDEFTPNTTAERVFAIGMFILAFIVASVFVSSITSSMTQLNIIGSHQSQQISALRRYLYQNGISNKLAVRIQRNAQHAVSEQIRTLPESSVAMLNVVSEPLRVEIHMEMYAPFLRVHPFFAKYLEECPQVMRKVCHTALSIMMVSTSDVIFCAGEIPSEPKMYIICSGQLEYERGMETVLIGENHWVSEAVLWVEWMHRGSLMATSDCRLCVLDAKKFQHICGEFSAGNFDPESYARDFADMLNEETAEPSDLPYDFDPTTGFQVATGSDFRRPSGFTAWTKIMLGEVRDYLLLLLGKRKKKARLLHSSKKTTEFT